MKTNLLSINILLEKKHRKNVLDNQDRMNNIEHIRRLNKAKNPDDVLQYDLGSLLNAITASFKSIFPEKELDNRLRRLNASDTYYGWQYREASPLTPYKLYSKLLEEGYLAYADYSTSLSYQTKDELMHLINSLTPPPNKPIEYNTLENNNIIPTFNDLSIEERIDRIIASLKVSEMRKMLNLKGYSKSKLQDEIRDKLGYSYFIENMYSLVFEEDSFKSFIKSRIPEYVIKKIEKENKELEKKNKRTFTTRTKKEELIEHIDNNFTKVEVLNFISENRPVVLTEKGVQTMIEFTYKDIIEEEYFEKRFLDAFYGKNEKYNDVLKEKYSNSKKEYNRWIKKEFPILPIAKKIEEIAYHRSRLDYSESLKLSLISSDYYSDINRLLSHYFYSIAIADFYKTQKTKIPVSILEQISLFDISLIEKILNAFYESWYLEFDEDIEPRIQNIVSTLIKVQSGEKATKNRASEKKYSGDFYLTDEIIDQLRNSKLFTDFFVVDNHSFN